MIHLSPLFSALIFDSSDRLGTGERTFDGYEMNAIKALKQRILKESLEHIGTSASILSLRPDRTKTGAELASDLRARLAEIGLKPADVLVRYVEDQNWINTPTARTLETNESLARSLGINKDIATWASPIYDKTPICIGSDHANFPNRVYIVMRASDLIRIDHIGDKDVPRPFYVFKNIPDASILAQIHDRGIHDMGQTLAAPKQPKPPSPNAPFG